MPRPIERLLTMVCKTPSYLAMKMAKITITKNGYRDNVAHALSLGRIDQGGLLDLILLLLGRLVFLLLGTLSWFWSRYLSLQWLAVECLVLVLAAGYKGAGGAGRRPLVLKRVGAS